MLAFRLKILYGLVMPKKSKEPPGFGHEEHQAIMDLAMLLWANVCKPCNFKA